MSNTSRLSLPFVSTTFNKTLKNTFAFSLQGNELAIQASQPKAALYLAALGLLNLGVGTGILIYTSYVHGISPEIIESNTTAFTLVTALVQVLTGLMNLLHALYIRCFLLCAKTQAAFVWEQKNSFPLKGISLGLNILNNSLQACLFVGTVCLGLVFLLGKYAFHVPKLVEESGNLIPLLVAVQHAPSLLVTIVNARLFNIKPSQILIQFPGGIPFLLRVFYTLYYLANNTLECLDLPHLMLAYALMNFCKQGKLNVGMVVIMPITFLGFITILPAVSALVWVGLEAGAAKILQICSGFFNSSKSELNQRLMAGSGSTHGNSALNA